MLVRLIADGDEAKTIVLEKEVALQVTGFLDQLGHRVEKKAIIWKEKSDRMTSGQTRSYLALPLQKWQRRIQTERR